MAELATIARPYAEALFQVARKGDLQAWLNQVEALAQVAQDAQLCQFAADPRTGVSQVVDVMSTASGNALSEGVVNFLRTLVDNGRLSALPEVAVQLRELVNQQGGVFDAVIYSAYPIDDAKLAELVAVLEQRFERKLSVRVELDPALIGGVKVKVGDEVLDTSVKARLEKMKVSLTA